LYVFHIYEVQNTKTFGISDSGVASPKILGGDKMFDFRRITLFCLEKRLSKHKMTIFSKHLGVAMVSLPLPPRLRLWYLNVVWTSRASHCQTSTPAVLLRTARQTVSVISLKT